MPGTCGAWPPLLAPPTSSALYSACRHRRVSDIPRPSLYGIRRHPRTFSGCPQQAWESDRPRRRITEKDTQEIVALPGKATTTDDLSHFFRDSSAHAPGPVAPHVEDNQTEKGANNGRQSINHLYRRHGSIPRHLPSLVRIESAGLAGAA